MTCFFELMFNFIRINNMNQIKRIRLERRIKACELAKKAKIDPSYVCLIENGRIPSKKVRSRIASTLKLPIKDLW